MAGIFDTMMENRAAHPIYGNPPASTRPKPDNSPEAMAARVAQMRAGGAKSAVGGVPGPYNPARESVSAQPLMQSAVRAYDATVPKGGFGLDILPTGQRPPLGSARNQTETSPGGYPYDTRSDRMLNPNSVTRGGATRGINPKDPNGAQLASSVNTFDMGAANAEYAEANDIRQQTIDAQPRGAGIVIPSYAGGGGGGQSVLDAQFKNAQAMARLPATGNRRTNQERNALYRTGQLLDATASNFNTSENNARTNDTIAQRAALDAQVSGQQQADKFALEAIKGRNALAVADANNAAEAPYREARGIAALATAQEKLGKTKDTWTTADWLDAATAGGEGFSQDILQYAPDEVLMALDSRGGATQGYRNGGYVESYAEGGVVGSALGAPAMPQQMGPDPAIMQQYQQYADGSRAMGLPAVPFNQFMEMSMGGGTNASASGQPPVMMAAGGQVPGAGGGQSTAAAGKMVIDTEEGAGTDSIPAVIDGERPAALNSGEFVFPTDVVMFYGTDKLNKMIAKVREPSDGGKSATGRPSPQ